ncbi:hypothetical protein HGA64_00710, partial [Candidatus Falkowbacteria bacterium]|nr:hypothetical protein [Candidatus Falkowbacteria bacterium]
MSVDTGSLAESPTNSSLDVPAETPATDQTAVPDISQEAATEKDSLMQSAAAGSGAYPLDNQASINRVN